MKGARFVVAIATIVLGSVAVSSAAAREFRVSNNGSCPNADFQTIQEAVTAAGPGDTVKVCPGTYPEQVRIPSGKNGLKLESEKPLQAVIQFPPVTTTPNSLVEVSQSRNVTIRGFTITGPFEDSECAVPLTRHYGVRVDNGGQAIIRDNHITQIRDANPLLLGCQDGVAILVGRQFEGTTGSAEIDHNVIDFYEKNGPTIDNVGSTATIENNTINGGGPTDTGARNGIQVGRGAVADVHNNNVFGNVYTGLGLPAAGDSPDDNDATGILVFEETGGVKIHDNEAYNNDLGIDIGTASGLKIRNNFTHDNTFDGLRAEADTMRILFAENRSQNNGTHDCHDDSHGNGTAGTANIWKNDHGVTQTPPGICKPKGD
jgi:parallel beta-helix repeat protein